MPEVECSSGTIDYEDSGGDGPVVVLVHGLIMDGSLWREVIDDLRADFRCIAPTLPLGGHRHPMHADADLSMRGVARLLGELLERLDLSDVTLAMNDWGGPQLLVGGAHDERIARLALCSCEAFDNVPPKGAAQTAPVHRADPRRHRRSALAVPRRSPAQAADDLRPAEQAPGPARDHGTLVRAGPREQREIRRDLRKYVTSAAEGRRDLLAAADALRAFDRPALVAWASEDLLMPREHGPRLAELLPQGKLLEIAGLSDR